MSLQAGDIFVFKVNSHRSFWNGEICSGAAEWKCGAEEGFRIRDCANGVRSCFHLNLFSPNSPRFVIPDPGVVKLFAKHQSLFDNQLIFFFGQNFNDESVDSNESKKQSQSYLGAYRVKSARLESVNKSGASNLVIEPYPDGWALFPHNLLRRESIAMPPAQEGISYMRLLGSKNALRLIEQTRDLITSCDLTKEQKEKLKRFCTAFPQWQKQAESALQDHALTKTLVFESPSATPFTTQLEEQLKGKLGDFQLREAAPESSHAPPTASDKAAEPTPASAAPADPPWSRRPLPEAGCTDLLRQGYGQGLIEAIKIGSLSKSLLIFTGPPGVGKSTIAGQLIDDAGRERERSIIVPVSSTWRGREDLLGYVNPVNNVFEPTAFTRFLLRAEQAWDSDSDRDRKTWLVVFEEFNLSQPEHWLSDLLVRLEYEPERRADRSIELGGERIAGEPEARASQVFLPPNLMLVATLNNDHTVRPLSPRVLDRGALIEISATGLAALELVNPDWPAEVKALVEGLNRILESRGVSFSVRSARSLQRAVHSLGAARMLTVLDHVLLQEVLSKVRLMAGDTRDEKLLRDLLDWSQDERHAELTLSRQRITAWNDALTAGRDVFQA